MFYFRVSHPAEDYKFRLIINTVKYYSVSYVHFVLSKQKGIVLFSSMFYDALDEETIVQTLSLMSYCISLH